MAILGLPAIAVINQHAIATFLAGNDRRKIGDSVAHAFHGARRRRQHIDPHRHRRNRRESNVGAVMALIRQPATAEILRGGAGVVIYILLDIAGLPQVTVCREGQFKGPRR